MVSRLLVAFLLLPTAIAVAAEKTTKESFTSDGVPRTYYLFVPDTAKDASAPLVILLHGSGRDGRILLDHWESLAKKEGIILVGPNATVRDGWAVPADGPLFLRHLVEALQKKVPFDPRRVYLFGHSAGAVHALAMGVLESEYFAAIVAHAGVLTPQFSPFVEGAPRKIPVGLWIGTSDPLFPVTAVRATRETFNQRGFDVELHEIKGHTHDYYSRSSEINKEVWAFLQARHLEKDPQYQDYAITR